MKISQPILLSGSAHLNNDNLMNICRVCHWLSNAVQIIVILVSEAMKVCLSDAWFSGKI